MRSLFYFIQTEMMKLKSILNLNYRAADYLSVERSLSA